MYLLDTNVVSELRKAAAGRAHPNVVRWAASVDMYLQYVSVITLMELEQGALLVARKDPQQGERLLAWVETQVLPSFEGRVVSIDTPIVRAGARLHIPDPMAERDAMIAATATVHGMTVVTRNVVDFEPMGVKILNPWL